MPGYTFHLSEGQLILDGLEQHGCHMSSSWKNLFLLGCLLPDCNRGMEKVESHFWDPMKLSLLKRRPELTVFRNKYSNTFLDPRTLGVWVHLHLDLRYMERVWDRNFCFMDSEGEPQEEQQRIAQVEIYGRERMPLSVFLSSEGLYGDYNRMNQQFVCTYRLQIPEYRADEWDGFPVGEMKPERLPQLLCDLEHIMDRCEDHAAEPGILRWKEINALLQDCAGEMLLKLLPVCQTIGRDSEKGTEYKG